MQPILHDLYDWRFVALSIAIAACASYIALSLARNKTVWQPGGAIATIGIGIWATHYIGVLACRLPFAAARSVPDVAVSVLAALISCVVALSIVSRKTLQKLHLTGVSLAMGAVIAAVCFHHPGASAIVAISILALSLSVSSVGRAVSRQALKRRPGAYDMEYRRLCHRDGTWRWILAPRHAAWDKDGCNHTS